MNENGVQVRSDAREVQDRNGIHCVRKLRMAFAIIDAVVGRRVDDHVRAEIVHHRACANVVGHVAFGPSEWNDIIRAKRLAQVLPQLSIGAEERNLCHFRGLPSWK
jgi:hypothetical protein